eukprot:CAMPEP_0116885198 /NCGR_PEP_ID=MMETSP0463-20121206/18464_1 /TAXON_ID=181622 /ORGANISM="Strombidinopsis sp, Strain SopsisLIS2011" /LENGTH=120 /DNA_ID=CAMNT_0004543211 /DNA_START=1506 /DNA_END=1868 /DNA_ORIENTATION=-
MTIINSYNSKVKNHVEYLNKRIEHLESQISNAFAEFKEHPYHLHSILVHDGNAELGHYRNAELGHYYAFVYDRNQSVWWRFNDHNVTMASEEEVFTESIGGTDSPKTAYSLIYINDKIAK